MCVISLSRVFYGSFSLRATWQCVGLRQTRLYNVDSYNDISKIKRLIDWLIDWIHCRVFCLMLNDNMTRHEARHILYAIDHDVPVMNLSKLPQRQRYIDRPMWTISRCIDLVDSHRPVSRGGNSAMTSPEVTWLSCSAHVLWRSTLLCLLANVAKQNTNKALIHKRHTTLERLLVGERCVATNDRAYSFMAS